MKPAVYITNPGLVSPLGFGVTTNFSQIKDRKSAIKKHDDLAMAKHPFYAGMVDETALDETFKSLGDASVYTKLEKMMLLSVAQTLRTSEEKITERTALIVATTKGNIDLLEKNQNMSENRVYLPEMAQVIAAFFSIKNTPIVVSNACVSGLLAVAVAKRMVQTNMYDNAIVVAGDLVSKFTLSGFQSFQALSDAPCKPYSKHRSGVSLGEAAASVIVTRHRPSKQAIKIVGDSSCNDANHISGPSRTGDGLYNSTIAALEEASLEASEIDFVSAHGTATQYNDEMEAIAFNRAQLQQTPLHSLKGIFGHTLGASGLVETVLGLEMINEQTILPCVGFDVLGTSKELNVVKDVQEQSLNVLLKTASGFGGCNTAVLFKKVS